VSFNIELNEKQIDGLIKLVLAEERTKKSLIAEQWERTPSGKPKDPIGYWKALFASLTSGGIGVKWEVPNDPVKSTFMYWGGWIIWKDTKKNGGYPVSFGTGKDGLTFAFYPKGTYAGQPLNNIELMSSKGSIPVFKLEKYAKKSTKEVADEFKKLLGNSNIKNIYNNVNDNFENVWKDLGSKLNSYKPSNSRYFETPKVKVIEYPGKLSLEFYKDGRIGWEQKQGVITFSGGKWIASSNEDGKLSGGWLISNQGKKVSLGESLSEPEFNFGNKPKRAVDELILGSYNLTEYIERNPEGKKYIEENKVKCGYSKNSYNKDTAITKSVYLCLLEKNPPTKMIAAALLQSKGTVIDDESLVEAAFLGIKTKSRYEQVKYYIGQDPYKYVANFMDTNIKYHKQAVFKTYSDITQGTVNSEEIKSGLCPVAKFTPFKPSGTNSHNPNPRDLVKLINDEFFKNRDLNRVPTDFGWKSNNNIYPFPKIYTKQEIQSCELKLKEKQTLNTQIYGKEMSNYLKNLPKNVTSDYANNSFKEYEKSDNTQNNTKENVDNMKAFNYLLTEQDRLIPTYCKTPWTKKVTYYPKSKLNQNKYGKVISYRLRAEGMTNSVTETIRINYADLCQDFGGLWVYGSTTSQYQCFCRDATHPSLTLNSFEPKQKSGYDQIDLTTGEQTKISLFDDNLKQRNWSTDDSKILLLDIIKILSAVFLPGMLSLVISSGISLGLAVKHYNDGKYYLCGIEIVFAILSAVGKIPGIKDHIKNELMSALRTLRRKGTLSPRQMKALVTVLGYESLGSDAMKKELIKKYGEKAVKNYGLHQILLNFGKEMEKAFAKALGVDKKGLSKMAQDI